MKFVVRRVGDMRIVLRGRMDGEAMREDGARLTALSTSSQDVIIDMWDVDYIDESGLGAIVYLEKRLRAVGRRVFITRLTGQPLEYLHKLGCTDLILPDDHPQTHMRALWAQRATSGKTPGVDKSEWTMEDRASGDRPLAGRSDGEAASASLF
jgi:anti-anti-sigma factor